METPDISKLVKIKFLEAAVNVAPTFPTGLDVFCVHEESGQPMQCQTAGDLTVIQIWLSTCSHHTTVYYLIKLWTDLPNNEFMAK